ncbi:MAG: AraC family transcriptional regulator [Deinococcota bacterium]|jgi:AraC-like DNA-binding protein|nr:AraC family transcriptional regulator [Deinococcota bacterium]
MILRDYGEPQRRGVDMNAPCKVFGWPNMVVQACAEAVFYPEHVSPLSIKTVLSGCEVNEVGRARFAVTKERYLLLNDGQRHAHAVDEGTEVFTVMFRTGFASEVLASLITPSERLLDDPEGAPEPVRFFERTYPHDPVLRSLLGKLQRRFKDIGASQDDLENDFHPLLERLLELHQGVYREALKLPAVRHATRVELYRRLWRARDFIEASFTTPIDLAAIAAAAALSPHHLLRLFKKVYGETPHRYVQRRRLEHARLLLLNSDRSVTDVCFDVGFESLGSFSTLFKTRLGVSPALYRTTSLRATEKQSPFALR